MELLQPYTRMPVQQVRRTVALKPNHVYVIPPNANLEAIDTHLRLSELEEPWGFEVNGSLALAYGPPSAGIEEPLERLEAFGRLIEEARERRIAETAVPERPDLTG